MERTEFELELLDEAEEKRKQYFENKNINV